MFDLRIALLMAQESGRKADACRILLDYLADQDAPPAVIAGLQSTAIWLQGHAHLLLPEEALTCVLSERAAHSLLLWLLRLPVDVRDARALYDAVRPRQSSLSPVRQRQEVRRWLHSRSLKRPQ